MSYNDYRKRILDSPDHSYYFHMSILGTNQQIRTEALDLFDRENIFVSISLDYVGKYRDWTAEFRDCGAVELAQHEQARNFPRIGMRIDFESDIQPPDNASPEECDLFVFAIEDFPAACGLLQRSIDRYQLFSSGVYIRVDISTRVSELSLNSRAGSKVSNCLDPLRCIRGARLMEIHGLEDCSYKAAIVATVCDRRLTLKEVISLV